MHPLPSSNDIYKPHIDGLRALAIVSVVIYHAFPEALSGGFMGVDVFFAISGYLITGIILRGLSAGTFSFADFYARRIRRIFPALLLVFLVAFIAGWIGLLASEFKQFGKHMAAGAGFAENLVLWREAGYFDTVSELKPLMHLWSLAIEEQYYLLYPLLVVAIWRLGWNLLLIIGVLMAGSFFWNIQQIHVDPVATFFLPQTRIWELLAGGVLACIHSAADTHVRHQIMAVSWRRFFSLTTNPPIFSNILAFIGIALILLPMWGINKQFAFPGWWALLPVAGVLLLIHAGDMAWINRRLLNNRLIVGIGLISYPLYLWHWPLLTFARLILLETPSPVIRGVLLLVSVMLAISTFIIIEKPIRSGRVSRPTTILLMTLMFAAGMTGYLVYRFDGIPSRDQARNDFDLYFESAYPEFKYIREQKIDQLYRQQCDFVGYEYKAVKDNLDAVCVTPRSDSTVFLWGDSHAQHLYHGLATALPKNISILQVTTSACVPRLDTVMQGTGLGCNKSNEFAIDTIKKTKPDVVIIATLSGHEVIDYDDIAKKMKAMGVEKIYLIGPVPHWQPFLNKVISQRYWGKHPKRLDRYLDKEIFELDMRLKNAYRDKKNIEYISLVNFLCDSKGCLARVGDDIRTDLIAWDYGHFTKVGSEYIGKNLLAPKVMSEWR